MNKEEFITSLNIYHLLMFQVLLAREVGANYNFRGSLDGEALKKIAQLSEKEGLNNKKGYSEATLKRLYDMKDYRRLAETYTGVFMRLVRLISKPTGEKYSDWSDFVSSFPCPDFTGIDRNWLLVKDWSIHVQDDKVLSIVKGYIISRNNTAVSTDFPASSGEFLQMALRIINDKKQETPLQQKINEIYDLFESSQLPTCLQKLKQFLENQPDSAFLKREVQKQISRLSELIAHERLGNLSREEIRLEKNDVREAILFLIDETNQKYVNKT